jgi:hypothetical protein
MTYKLQVYDIFFTQGLKNHHYNIIIWSVQHRRANRVCYRFFLGGGAKTEVTDIV